MNHENYLLKSIMHLTENFLDHGICLLYKCNKHTYLAAVANYINDHPLGRYVLSVLNVEFGFYFA